MIGRTHALGGAAMAAGAVAITGNIEHVPVWAYAVAYATALAPDMDQATSTAGRKWYTKPLGLIMQHFTHRGATHSITVGVPVALAFFMLVWGLVNTYSGWTMPIGVPIVATIGYASHIVLDMMNKQGVWLFWPFLRRRSGPGFKNGFFYLPLPRIFRIRTGGSRLGKNTTGFQALRHELFAHNYEKWIIRLPLKASLVWLTLKNIDPVIELMRTDWSNFLGLMPTQIQPLLQWLLW